MLGPYPGRLPKKVVKGGRRNASNMEQTGTVYHPKWLCAISIGILYMYVYIYIYHDFFGKMMIALICVIRDNYGELWRMKKEPSNFGVPKTLHAPTVNRLVSWLLSGGIYTALFLLEKSSHFVIAS
jgi:hypothetical protein